MNYNIHARFGNLYLSAAYETDEVPPINPHPVTPWLKVRFAAFSQINLSATNADHIDERLVEMFFHIGDNKWVVVDDDFGFLGFATFVAARPFIARTSRQKPRIFDAWRDIERWKRDTDGYIQDGTEWGRPPLPRFRLDDLDDDA
jgi:hypothetical protein